MTRPADIALRDQAIAETTDDLNKLISHARKLIADGDPEDALDSIVLGLLNEPSWGRLELCSVLGLTVVELAKADTPGGSR